MNFFLTFCKNRKKFDKYVKVNKIKNKTIIDIASIINNENINLNNRDSLYYFKVLIYKKIQSSLEKEKDIYYLPNFHNQNFEIEKIIQLKDIITYKDQFNLLLFHNEFLEQPKWINYLIERLDFFDATQIIKDY